MNTAERMLPAIWNAISLHVAILEESGEILDVNPAWEAYRNAKGGEPKHCSKGTNYLDVCDASTLQGNNDASIVAAGIRNLFNSEGAQEFTLEYPCHSPDEQSWYQFKGWRLDWEDGKYAIISHKDVTQTVLQRQALQSEALTDNLTGIANRRHFDRFFAQEWRRDMRRGTPLSLIMLDVDYFKQYNDHYGHIAGDNCLKRIAEFLKTIAQRPGDLVVRFGGEEFAVIMGATPEKAAQRFAEFIRSNIESLSIPNENASKTNNMITVSVGVATIVPKRDTRELVLLELADESLYQAKNNGRNTVVVNNS